MSIATLALFQFPFAWNTFIHPLTFSLYVSLGLKSGSQKQHIQILFLDPFSQSVSFGWSIYSINMQGNYQYYVSIGIFLIVLHLFLQVVFFSMFHTQGSSFSICCKAVLVVLNSCSFYFSVKFLISLLNLNNIHAGQNNLGCRFFPFITWNISCYSLFLYRVSAEKSADNLMGFPIYVFCCFSFAAFNIFSLNLIFDRVLCVSACFSLGLSCVELWAAYTWVAVSFAMLLKFSTKIF